ncbi:MAG: hypothetical protein ACK5LX_01060 [Oscillospiraceae bacterium]
MLPNSLRKPLKQSKESLRQTAPGPETFERMLQGILEEAGADSTGISYAGAKQKVELLGKKNKTQRRGYYLGGTVAAALAVMLMVGGLRNWSVPTTLASEEYSIEMDNGLRTYIPIIDNDSFLVGYADGGNYIEVHIQAKAADAVDWSSITATDEDGNIVQPNYIDEEYGIAAFPSTGGELELNLTDTQGNPIKCSLPKCTGDSSSSN